MFAFLISRPHFAKLVTAVLMAAQLLGWITVARANDEPSAPPGDNVHAIHCALREFDRFLDHHPLLEDDLRINPALVSNDVYLKDNPELHDFLGANGDVLTGLKYYPRYFLYRALLRQADAPLRYAEISKFKDLFDQTPGLEQALTKKPDSIRDPAFLKGHPRLHDFLLQNPELGKVFLPHDVVATGTF